MSGFGKPPRPSGETKGEKKMKKFLAKRRGEKGQGLVEYALIIVLIAIVCIAGLRLLGPQVNTVFNNITTELQNSGTS
jgi:pilus assembly protein Flp/PilA